MTSITTHNSHSVAIFETPASPARKAQQTQEHTKRHNLHSLSGQELLRLNHCITDHTSLLGRPSTGPRNSSNTMPKSVDKIRKHIAKKKGGAVDVLHEKSRDARRLHKAAVRDQRLAKLNQARNRREHLFSMFGPYHSRPYIPMRTTCSYATLTVDRVHRFVDASEGKPMTVDEVQAKINEYVRRTYRPRWRHLTLVVRIANIKACRLVHQYDEELAEVQKSRRPGRPPSTKEDLLKMKIAALEKEQQNGFRMYFARRNPPCKRCSRANLVFQ